MQFNNFGRVDVLAWGLMPKYDEVADESFMVFKTIADDNTELYVATCNSRAWLRLRNDDGWDTYYGVSDESERIALEKLYFGGC